MKDSNDYSYFLRVRESVLKIIFNTYWILVGMVIGLLINLFTPNTTVVYKEINKPNQTIILADTIKPYSSLVDSNVYREIVSNNIHHPDIVLAQAKLETGNYKSKVCTVYNNLFGLRKPDGSYYKFNSWQESVKAYKDWVQNKYTPPNDYYDFLDSIRYAEDDSYINKLRDMV